MLFFDKGDIMIKFDKVLRRINIKLCDVELKYLGYNMRFNNFTFAYIDNLGVIHKITLAMHEVKILIIDTNPSDLDEIKEYLNF